MSVTKSLDTIFFKTSKFVRAALVGYSEKINIKRKKRLVESVELTSEQETEIRSFYKEYYGKEIPLLWHKLYQSYTGCYQKDYFPEYLFSTKLEPMTNPYQIAEFLGDKNLIPTLFKGVEGLHIPSTYLSCVNGKYQDHDFQYITEQGGASVLANIGRCVVKKTIDTSSGRDVQVCSFKDGIDIKTQKNIADILKMFGKNFVVQECIEQHESLAKLNSTSVNTFRAITYILDGKVYNCPLALRLGRSNADRDNIHYGGLSIGVNDDGTLMTTAFSEFGERYTQHPDSKIQFEGYKLGGDSKILSVNTIARKLHERIPYLGIISWDLTLDKDGTVTIIEMNSTGQSAWFPQMVTGKSLFGENTPRVLEMIRNK